MTQNTPIEIIEAHCREFGLKESSLGQMAGYDGRTVERVRRGSVSVNVQNNILAWIEADRESRMSKRALKAAE